MKRAISLGRVESFPRHAAAKRVLPARTFREHCTSTRRVLPYARACERASMQQECIYIFPRQADKPRATSSFINKYELSLARVSRYRICRRTKKEGRDRTARRANSKNPAEIFRHSCTGRTRQPSLSLVPRELYRVSRVCISR